MNDEGEQYDYRTRRAMIFDGMAIVNRISRGHAVGIVHHDTNCAFVTKST